MKNKTKKRIGIAAAMLGVVVAIGATAGTTLAKYITSATVEGQTATVAAWGYTVTTNADDLFSEQYDQGKIVTAGNDTIDVKASSEVVAPGTSSEGTTDGKLVVTINGYAEVDAQLVIDITSFNTVWLNTAEVVANTSEKLGTATYYPLQWTITAGGDTNKVDLTFTKTSTTDLATELATQIATNLAYDGVLPTGATVNTTASTGGKVVIDLPVEKAVKFENYKLTIAWKWAFEKNEQNPNSNDAYDTVLGWLAYNANEKNTDKIDGGITVDNSATTAKEVTVSGLKTLASSNYNLGVELGCKIQVVQVQTQS